MEEKEGTGRPLLILKSDDGRKKLERIDPCGDGRLERKLRGTGLGQGGEGRLLSLRRATGKLGRAAIGAATIRFFKRNGRGDPQPSLKNQQQKYREKTLHRATKVSVNGSGVNAFIDLCPGQDLNLHDLAATRP